MWATHSKILLKGKLLDVVFKFWRNFFLLDGSMSQNCSMKFKFDFGHYAYLVRTVHQRWNYLILVVYPIHTLSPLCPPSHSLSSLPVSFSYSNRHTLSLALSYGSNLPLSGWFLACIEHNLKVPGCGVICAGAGMTHAKSPRG